MVHEWALAEAIIETSVKLAEEKKAKRIKRIMVRLGVLQSIDKDILSYSLNILRRECNIPIEQIVFESEDVVFRCRKCGYEWGLDEMKRKEEIMEAIHFIPEVIYAYVKCPKCNSTDFKIVSGRGVSITRIEVVK